jgi:hypothetical protein
VCTNKKIKLFKNQRIRSRGRKLPREKDYPLNGIALIRMRGEVNISAPQASTIILKYIMSKMFELISLYLFATKYKTN